MLTVSFQEGNIEMDGGATVSRMTESDMRTVAKGRIALFSLFVVFPGGFVHVFSQSSLVSTLLYMHSALELFFSGGRGFESMPFYSGWPMYLI